MSFRKIRFGLIGAAHIAVKFCDAAAHIDDVSVCAVASKCMERARDFARSNGIPSFYDSYEMMLSRDDIDAVYIATTHNFHYENIMMALSYGKHVLCEKCMVLTKAEAETVFQKSRETGLFVMECMWSRFQPAFMDACRWIHSGEIGDVVTASYQVGFQASEGNRVIDPLLAGGALFDIGVYAIEGLHALIGRDIRKVVAYLDDPRGNGVDITDHIILIFDDHCTANILCSVGMQNFHKGAVVYGTKGIVTLPNPIDAGEAILRRHIGEETVVRPPKHGNGFIYEIEDAVRCIREGKIESAVIPHQDTLLCAEVFDLCRGISEK